MIEPGKAVKESSGRRPAAHHAGKSWSPPPCSAAWCLASSCKRGVAKYNVLIGLQPTRLGAQSIGSLIFGAEFALIAYCPGTGAAALGQRSWDVLFGMAGLVTGSYLCAELSAWRKRTVEQWGAHGKITIPDLLHLPRVPFAFAAAVLLAAGLFLLERAFPR